MCRKFRNQELSDFPSSPCIIQAIKFKENEMDTACGTYREGQKMDTVCGTYREGQKFKENEMDTACGTYREGQKSIQGYVGKPVKEPTLKIWL
jgi:hypothetical protein